jgi:hypothetical protein
MIGATAVDCSAHDWRGAGGAFLNTSENSKRQLKQAFAEPVL